MVLDGQPRCRHLGDCGRVVSEVYPDFPRDVNHLKDLRDVLPLGGCRLGYSQLGSLDKHRDTDRTYVNAQILSVVYNLAFHRAVYGAVSCETAPQTAPSDSCIMHIVVQIYRIWRHMLVAICWTTKLSKVGREHVDTCATSS